ncbi:MAG: tRNA (cytidine(34)-2'-O)-methyltransferase [Oscillospiraceae bacterium]|jgi:tRNA (cytidine/uridine-2'-O-)-methyltransferase|nr:tRNA (cytidine(34)-2'-O)-methyltransferase [Oscillospiraceae bacterium]
MPIFSDSKKLHLVLVEPQIPQNTGNIARTCAATGAVLHLIEPLGFAIDDTKLKRAGLDYWHMLDVRYYPNLAAFFDKNHGAFYYFSTKAARTYSDPAYEDEVYLFFGKETAGLPEELLRAHFDRVVRLPMREGARSLNLSNTVAVAAFEVLRQWGFPRLQKTSDAFRQPQQRCESDELNIEY